MVIQSKVATKPLTSLCPFVIEKTITGLIGSPKSVKKLKYGCLLVECQRRGQTESVKKIKTFFDIPAQSFAHSTLNTSKGVIRCRYLAGVTDSDIIEGMKNEGVNVQSAEYYQT